MIWKYVMWINFAFGIYNLYMLFSGKTEYFLIVFAVNLLVTYIATKSFPRTIIAALGYPFALLPGSGKVSWEKREYVNVNVTEEPAESGEDILPMKDYILAGTSDEKKYAIIELVKNAISGTLDIGEVVDILKKFISDEHPDVALYASESIEKIESHLLKRMRSAKISPLEFAQLTYAYISAEFAHGKLKEHYRNLALKALEKAEKTEEYYVLYYKLSGDKKILEEGLQKTGSKKIAEELIYAELKDRNFKAASEIRKKYIQPANSS